MKKLLLLFILYALPVNATVTITNFNGGGSAVANQVVKFDTDGNAIDAHDSGIIQFGSDFYLIGTCYGTGWQLTTTVHNWCGFKIYHSTDLVNWTYVGQPFDPASFQTRCSTTNAINGCYRIKIIFNAANKNYVLWFNDTSLKSGYAVMISNTLTSGYTEVTAPNLGSLPDPNNGDEDLFVDSDNSAYIVWTNFSTDGTHRTVYIQQLTSNYQAVTGSPTVVVTAVEEASTIFKNGSTYYIVDGPACGYCGATPTRYYTASTPLGTWSSGTQISSTSCGGQDTKVSTLTINSTTVQLYQSDLWFAAFADNTHPPIPNQARANYFWIPLSFTGSAINNITCSTNFTAALTANPPITPPTVNQNSGSDGFTSYCDITGTTERLQTFTPNKSSSLIDVKFTLFQGNSACAIGDCGGPTADLTASLVNISSGVPSTTIHDLTVSRSTLSWSPQVITLSYNNIVTSGTIYGVVLKSTTSTGNGCYGLTYNDANPLANGSASYSGNTGSTWTNETSGTRDLKFLTDMPAPITTKLGVNIKLNKSLSIGGQ